MYKSAPYHNHTTRKGTFFNKYMQLFQLQSKEKHSALIFLDPKSENQQSPD